MWLLSYMALWLFRIPSLGRARAVLMMIYGELGRTAWFPKCPGFLSLTNSEFAHDEESGFGRHCTEFVR